MTNKELKELVKELTGIVNSNVYQYGIPAEKIYIDSVMQRANKVQ